MSKETKQEQESREKKRTSLILYADTFKKVKYISLMDEEDITSIVEEALSEYISKWEKKNGMIPKK